MCEAKEPELKDSPAQDDFSDPNPQELIRQSPIRIHGSLKESLNDHGDKLEDSLHNMGLRGIHSAREMQQRSARVFLSVGSLFVVVGLAFFFICGSKSNVSARLAYLGDLQETQGVMLEVHSINYKWNEQWVYQYDFEFEHQKKVFRGTSFNVHPLSAERPIQIEYPRGKPEWARVKGSSISGLPWLVFTILFGIGFTFMGSVSVIAGLKGSKSRVA